MAERWPVVIVGSGIAGLWAALQAAPLPVLLLTAGRMGQDSSTRWAQGGIAAPLAADDSPQLHLEDTIAAGAGLVDEHVAERVVAVAADEVRALEAIGVPFEHDADGGWTLSLEAAHRRARVAQVRGDQAGHAIIDALVDAISRAPHVAVREHCPVQGLATSANGECAGVMVSDGGGGMRLVPARAVILATGGLGGLYAVTTNPHGHRGQALAWAARLGATIRDAEFVQFHPTAIDIGLDPAPLATEALRGEGAYLVDRHGRRFMPQVHPDAELAPRDIVARAVFAQIRAGEGAFLDARKAVGSDFPSRFPGVFSACRMAGIDPREQPIPVAPAAHYHMGGIAINGDGSSAVAGLYAVGECACTGMHGANRLASNSLLECLVTARWAAKAVGERQAPNRLQPDPPLAAPAALDDQAISELRQAMSKLAGVERDGAGLSELLQHIERLQKRHGEADVLATARLVAGSALARSESRGAHWRSDFPQAATVAESSRITPARASTARRVATEPKQGVDQ
jgi:L-aspartate oxidase